MSKSLGKRFLGNIAEGGNLFGAHVEQKFRVCRVRHPAVIDEVHARITVAGSGQARERLLGAFGVQIVVNLDRDLRVFLREGRPKPVLPKVAHVGVAARVDAKGPFDFARHIGSRLTSLVGGS